MRVEWVFWNAIRSLCPRYGLVCFRYNRNVPNPKPSSGSPVVKIKHNSINLNTC